MVVVSHRQSVTVIRNFKAANHNLIRAQSRYFPMPKAVSCCISTKKIVSKKAKNELPICDTNTDLKFETTFLQKFKHFVLILGWHSD